MVRKGCPHNAGDLATRVSRPQLLADDSQCVNHNPMARQMVLVYALVLQSVPNSAASEACATLAC